MFFKLAARNSRRSRKENGLFFSALLLSIIAFYMILALSQQDVMVFLRKMESDAVNRLLLLIPVFYMMTLVILFCLIYFASKFQLMRRNHEFGVYLMLGMSRKKLFLLLLAEDIRSSLLALAAGLPAAVLLSEIVSLITARLVGLGILGHQLSFSLPAVLGTAGGFFGVKLLAFLILSGKLAGQEIGSLLVETPEGVKKEKKAGVYVRSFLLGLVCLFLAYAMLIRGTAWNTAGKMELALLLLFAGTLWLFDGLRAVMNRQAQRGLGKERLGIFNFRQLQERVICQSKTMAISSLLILAALSCLGAGVAITSHYSDSEPHVLDYTFRDYTNPEEVWDALANAQLTDSFSTLFEMKTGHIRTEDGEYVSSAAEWPGVEERVQKLPDSEAKKRVLNQMQYSDSPYLISLEGYNRLLACAGEAPIELQENEAAIYQDRHFVTKESKQIFDELIAQGMSVEILGEEYRIRDEVRSTKIVTDRLLTLSLALILPDEVFERYTRGECSVYINGVLAKERTAHTSLLQAIFTMNQELDSAGIAYESYLQNIGRQLFYMVAASYLTIYLAVIFLIVANTVIGVQFLMGQQKTGRRYRTLIRLGAEYEVLGESMDRQVNWYFGIPVVIGAANSLFAVRGLFSGILVSRTTGSIGEMLLVAAAMILLLCVVEYLYMRVVKKAARRYLLTLLAPQREE